METLVKGAVALARDLIKGQLKCEKSLVGRAVVAISLRRSLCNALEIRVQWPGQEKQIRRHVSQPESIVRQRSNTWSVGGRSLDGPKSSSLWLRCLLLWFFWQQMAARGKLIECIRVTLLINFLHTFHRTRSAYDQFVHLLISPLLLLHSNIDLSSSNPQFVCLISLAVKYGKYNRSLGSQSEG